MVSVFFLFVVFGGYFLFFRVRVDVVSKRWGLAFSVVNGYSFLFLFLGVYRFRFSWFFVG